jgi:hypothetical protein
LFLGAVTVTEVACLRSNTEPIGSASIVDGNSSYQTLTQPVQSKANTSVLVRPGTTRESAACSIDKKGPTSLPLGLMTPMVPAG